MLSREMLATAHSRRRKARTVFTEIQLNGLEKEFKKRRYLSTYQRAALANTLKLNETQVKAVIGISMIFTIPANRKFN